MGLTGGDVEAEAKRTLVTEPATKVYTVTVCRREVRFAACLIA